MSKTDDAIAYLQAQYEQEWEQDFVRRHHHEPLFRSSYSKRLQKMEEEFYRNTKKTPAMLAAINAIKKYKMDR